MKKIVSRGACLLFALCLSLNAVGCQKSNENNKISIGGKNTIHKWGWETKLTPILFLNILILMEI